MVLLIILVAGLSSRYGKHTKFTGSESNQELRNKLKQFAKIKTNDEKNKYTFIEYSVEQALSTPFEAIVLITNPNTDSLFQSTFGHSIQTPDRRESIPIHFVQQKCPNYRNKPFGSADAVTSVVPFIEEHNEYRESPIVVVNGDDLYGADTYNEVYKLVSHGIDVIGTLPLYQTVTSETSIVNRGFVFLKQRLKDDVVTTKVTEMQECLNITLSKYPELRNIHTNVNCFGLQPNTLRKLKQSVDLKIQQCQEHEKKYREFILVNELNNLVQDDTLDLYQFPLTHPICGITHVEDVQHVEKFLQNTQQQQR